jgi:hypothetical protein
MAWSNNTSDAQYGSCLGRMLDGGPHCGDQLSARHGGDGVLTAWAQFSFVVVFPLIVRQCLQQLELLVRR